LLVDDASGLVCLRGNTRLDHAERTLRERGLTLGVDAAPDLDVDGLIASGMRGMPDPFDDPVEQRLAGISATLSSGAPLDLAPAPRRATGPDLGALFVGAERRVGRVDRAWLRARVLGATGARALPFSGERAPALEPGERDAFEAVVVAFRTGRPRDARS
jgi:alkyldihydroxyacetonephosphate synthase